MASFFRNPKPTDRGETLEATLGARTSLVGPSRVIIESAYVSANFNVGDQVYVRDTNSFWLAVTDPGSTTPGATVLVMIEEGGPSAGGSSAPDLLVVVGQSPKYTLSPSQRTTIFGASGGVALAVALGGASVLVLPGTYDHSALGVQTVPANVDIVGMADSPTEVDIVGPIDFEQISAISNCNVSNPLATGYTVRVTGGFAAFFSAVNCIFYAPADPGAGLPAPAFLYDGTSGGSIELNRVTATKILDGDNARTAIRIANQLDQLTLRAVTIDDVDDASTHAGISLRTENTESTDTVTIDENCVLRGRLELAAGQIQFGGDLRTQSSAFAPAPIRLTSAGTPTTQVRLLCLPTARIRHNSPNAVIEGAAMVGVDNIIVSWTTLQIRSDVAPANILGNYCRFARTAAEGLVAGVQSGVTVVVNSNGAVPAAIPAEVDTFVLGTGVTSSPSIQMVDGARTAHGRAVEVLNLGSGTATLTIGTGTGNFDQSAASLAIPTTEGVRLRWVDDGTIQTWATVANKNSGGAPAGAALKYIVAPAWMALPNTYLTATGPAGAIAAAIADGASDLQPADVFYMPSESATYVEDFTIATGTPLRAGINLVGWCPDRFAQRITSNAGPIEFTGSPGRTSISNLYIQMGPGISSLVLSGTRGVSLIGTTLESNTSILPSVYENLSVGASLELHDSTILNTSPIGQALSFAGSNVQFEAEGNSQINQGFADGVATWAATFSNGITITRNLHIFGPCRTNGTWTAHDTTVEASAPVGPAVTVTGSLNVRGNGFSALNTGAGGPSLSGTGVVNIYTGTLRVDASVGSSLTVSVLGPAGRCRYIQRIAITAAALYGVNYGVDTVWVDPQVAGGTVELQDAATQPDGWEVEVLSAPSSATYIAGTTNSFVLQAGGSPINNASSVVVAFEDSYVLRADRTEGRYRWAP